jgi:hypothetical protein
MNSMLRRLLALLIFVCGVSAFGQSVDPTRDIKWTKLTGSGVPSSGACTTSNRGQAYTDITNNIEYWCGSGGWFTITGGTGGGGSAPGGVLDSLQFNAGGGVFGGDNAITTDGAGDLSVVSLGGTQIATTPWPTTTPLSLPSGWTAQLGIDAAGNFRCQWNSGTECTTDMNTSGTAANGYNGTVTYTASHTISASDNGKLVVMNCGSACVLTLPASQPFTTWQASIKSVGASTATVALSGGATYNGSASVPVLNKYAVLRVEANTQTANDYRGDIPFVAGSGVTLSPAPNGITVTATGSGGASGISATPGTMLKAVTSTTAGDSAVSDDGTNVTSSETLVAPQFNSSDTAHNGYFDLTAAGAAAPSPAPSTVRLTVPNAVVVYTIVFPSGPRHRAMVCFRALPQCRQCRHVYGQQTKTAKALCSV